MTAHPCRRAPPTVLRSVLLTIPLAVVTVAAPAIAPASAPYRAPALAPQSVSDRPAPPETGSRFACGDDRELILEFVKGPAGLVSVDVGEGPHVLSPQPWPGGEPRVTWSDGQRTLVWNVGVKLMWMDGSSHLACGRAEHHH